MSASSACCSVSSFAAALLRAIALHLVRGDGIAVDGGDDPVHHLGARPMPAARRTNDRNDGEHAGRPRLMAGGPAITRVREASATTR